MKFEAQSLWSSLKAGLWCVAVTAALMMGLSCAQATTLLSLSDATGSSNYSPTFVATGPNTIISFAGYDVPASITVSNIGLFQNAAGANLLASPWNLTRAPSGSFAFQSGGVLTFQGIKVGNYDTFYQTIATSIGTSYSLDFKATFDCPTCKPRHNGLVVTASAVSTTPLPAALPLFATGLGFAGLFGWQRKRKKVAAMGAA